MLELTVEPIMTFISIGLIMFLYTRRVWNRTCSRANLNQTCKPSQYFCLFDDVFWGSRILSFLKPNLPKPKRQRKIRRRFCPGLSSTFMRPVSSRLAQFFAQVSTRGVFQTPLPSANHTTNR